VRRIQHPAPRSWRAPPTNRPSTALPQADPARAPLIRREPLTTTLAGNVCDLLTITEPTNDAQELGRRKGAVVSGGQRVESRWGSL
jgi:hypothetical protein